MWTTLEKNGSPLKSDELTNYKLVDRKNLNLNLDTAFVKISQKLTSQFLDLLKPDGLIFT